MFALFHLKKNLRRLVNLSNTQNKKISTTGILVLFNLNLLVQGQLAIAEETVAEPIKIENSKRLRRKPWNQRLEYVFSARHDREIITMPQSVSSNSSLFTIDSKPFDLALSVGGKLFQNTSVFTELMINRNKYTYNQANPKVDVDSSEWRFDVLLEHDFGQGYTLGADGYYADRSDKYDVEFQLPGQKIVQRYSDDVKALGMDLMASKSWYLTYFDLRFDYNFSYWNSDVNGKRVPRHYHNVAFSQSKLWRYNLQSVFSVQHVDFPDDYFVLTEYIGDVYFASGELNYWLTNASQFSLGWQRLEFGSRSSIDTWSFRFEYQFGLDETKRRVRRYRVPKPIYRIRGLLH